MEKSQVFGLINDKLRTLNTIQHALNQLRLDEARRF
jgi:hypothetical protein